MNRSGASPSGAGIRPPGEQAAARTPDAAESTNRTLYLLSVGSAVFLPLAFLTGSLGIDVGGIPGANEPSAFWLVAAPMPAIALGELVPFRVMRWLG